MGQYMVAGVGVEVLGGNCHHILVKTEDPLLERNKKLHEQTVK